MIQVKEARANAQTWDFLTDRTAARVDDPAAFDQALQSAGAAAAQTQPARAPSSSDRNPTDLDPIDSDQSSPRDDLPAPTDEITDHPDNPPTTDPTENEDDSDHPKTDPTHAAPASAVPIAAPFQLPTELINPESPNPIDPHQPTSQNPETSTPPNSTPVHPRTEMLSMLASRPDVAATQQQIINSADQLTPDAPLTTPDAPAQLPIAPDLQPTQPLSPTLPQNPTAQETTAAPTTPPTHQSPPLTIPTDPAATIDLTAAPIPDQQLTAPAPSPLEPTLDQTVTPNPQADLAPPTNPQPAALEVAEPIVSLATTRTRPTDQTPSEPQIAPEPSPPESIAAPTASTDSNLASSSDHQSRQSTPDLIDLSPAQPATARPATELAQTFPDRPTAQPTAAQMQENVDRVLRAVNVAHTRRQSAVQIRLEPAELGAIRVEIRSSAQGLTLRLETSSLHAQEILQQNSAQLRTALEAQGLNNPQIDIQLRLDLRNEPNPQSTQDQSSFSQQDQPSSQNPDQQEQPDPQQYQWPSTDDAEPQGHGSPAFSPSDSPPLTDLDPGHPSDDQQWHALEFTAVDLQG